MGELKITGHSDDIVSVSGDVDEEFASLEADEREVCIGASDGSVIACRYGEHGIWRFGVAKMGAGTQINIIPCPDPTGEDKYTDTAVLTRQDPFDWVMCGQIRHRGK